MSKDIIAIQQLTKKEILSILQLASEYQEKGIPGDVLKGKLVGSLFFEPSTRTRLSFEAAAQRLGAGVIGFSGTESTSVKKGESLEDTIRMVDGYVDAIVMRHPEIGSATRAAEVAMRPVINGGDGANEHPTQTLIDLYAIQRTQGTLDGLTVAMVGDLKYGRVPHSLAKALAHFPTTKQIWVAHDLLKMPEEVKAFVQEKGIAVEETEQLEDVLSQADIVMMTRVQQERFADVAEYEKVKDVYVLRPEMVAAAKKSMKILHPLPRLYEIPTTIDTLKHAYYFQQAQNGMYVRAALLTKVLT